MDIIVTGSIAYDYLMRFPGKFGDHFISDQLHKVSLSFLVDDMTKHWGGVAANIAYTMALLGLQPKLMGTAGRDFRDFRERLENVGVDCSTVRQHDEVFTASFFCTTDDDNNQIASFYAGAMGLAHKYAIADVYDGVPDLVIISPNDPKAMQRISQECRDRGLKFLYDPSQQLPRLSGEELARDMQGAYALVVNAYEADMIMQKTDKTLDEIAKEVEILVITQGPEGCHIYHNGTITDVEAFPTDKRTDPTGVGDAFRAGLVYGMMSDWPLKLAAQVGSLCATYVLELVGTQSHHYSVDEFVARFRKQYDDEGRLDVLLERVQSS